MRQNLLTKTLRWYLLFAIVTLIATGLISYFVTKRLYIDEANETLKLHKKEFLRYHQPKLTIDKIREWNHYNRDEKIIEPQPKRKKDKFTTVFYYDTLSNENEPYRVLMSPITIEGKPFTLFARINLVEREDLMKTVAMLFTGLAAVMLIGLYFITRIMSKKLWKPFYNALEQLEHFEVDKTKATHFPPTDVNEFHRLNTAIEELIRKNTSIYNTQKEFIENAAHELQTPLAVIQGKLETLFQQSNLTQDQSEALEKLNDSISRLSRLNKNLLLLSRIEHDQFSETEKFSLDNLIKKHLDFFAEQAQSKGISINMELNEPIQLNTNPVLTEVLFNNLMLNAIRHNLSGGVILIQLDSNKLTISNSGTTALALEKIFDRFAKTNSSTQGNGLGLAIVKKISDLNGWRIHYSFHNSFHKFQISF